MNILFLPNWNLQEEAERLNRPIPKRYYIAKLLPDIKMDVIDTSSFKCIEKFEKHRLHFYVIQALKALFKIQKYDLIFCDGMQSAIVLALIFRFFKPKQKLVVLDIGCFNSGASSGFAMRLMQLASKSIDHLIFHSSIQKEYYARYYPWLYSNATFIPLGIEFGFLGLEKLYTITEKDEKYILVIGGDSMMDIDTLIKAYANVETNVPIKIIGMNGDLVSTDSRIQFLPRVTFPELLNLINKSLFCINPLQYSKFSYGQLRFMHEMLQYKAIIASEVPSLVDYAIDGKLALFYPAGDCNALSDKIRFLLNDEQLRYNLGINAHNYAVANNSFEVMANRMYKVFELLLE